MNLGYLSAAKAQTAQKNHVFEAARMQVEDTKISSFYRSDATPNQWHKITPPLAAPTHLFRGNQAQAASFSDFKGKRILLNFWASWCAPCLSEMPALNALAKAHENSLYVMVMNIEKIPYTKAQKILGEYVSDSHLILAQDQLGSVFAQLGKGRLPLSYMLNEAGEIEAFYIGTSHWNAPAHLPFILGK
jgi:thiol-disulfide isomerase/thioredoxin